MSAGDGADLREVHQAAGHERGAGHEDALHQLRAGEVRFLPERTRRQAGRPDKEVKRTGPVREHLTPSGVPSSWFLLLVGGLAVC